MLSRPNKQRHHNSRLATVLLLLVWLAGLGTVAANRQNLQDWWRLRDYQAPAAISQIATQATMTDFGRKVFYVNQPEIVSKAQFGQKCPSHGGEQTIVLGCYHTGQSGIYVLDVSDVRLEGVEQVTAAHEMLHAAYDRLNSEERKRVDGLLNDFYKTLKDKRILETIDAYKQSEPDDLVNEMHSIFATEISSLPVALETYYSRYFSNRAQVAAFAAQYQSEFTSRQDQVARDDIQLTKLKEQIEAAEADLKPKQAEIDRQQSALIANRNNGNIAAYNAGVPIYNQLVDSYNSEVELIKSLISQYNDLVARRNAVALEESKLVEELRPTEASTINN